MRLRLPEKLLGAPVRVHWTFPAALLLLLLMIWDAPPGRRGATALLVFSALAALLLHEAGHALAARAFQVRVGGVVLHFFGGLTQLDPGPLGGWKEIPVAAGGPLVNLLLALFALVPSEPFHTFGRVNLLFGGLNLVPAWPLDGGRLLRAVLALFILRGLATVFSGVLGLFLCGGLFFYGLFAWEPWALLGGPFLAVVGLKALLAEMDQQLAQAARRAGPWRAPGAWEEGPEGPFFGGTASPWEEEDPEEAREAPEGFAPKGTRKKESLARRLSRFHGSLAEFLERRRRGEP